MAAHAPHRQRRNPPPPTTPHSSLSSAYSSQPQPSPSPPPPEFTPLTAAALAAASPATLRAKLAQAQALIGHLRTAVSHASFSHTVLSLDTAELRERHQVEVDISAAQVAVLKQQKPEVDALRRRLKRAKRRLSDYAAENAALRSRLGEGEGLEALGMLATQVLEATTPPPPLPPPPPQARKMLLSPVAFRSHGKRRRVTSRDSTISVEDLAAEQEEEESSPSPRKRMRSGDGLGTPVSPR